MSCSQAWIEAIHLAPTHAEIAQKTAVLSSYYPFVFLCPPPHRLHCTAVGHDQAGVGKGKARDGKGVVVWQEEGVGGAEVKRGEEGVEAMRGAGAAAAERMRSATRKEARTSARSQKKSTAVSTPVHIYAPRASDFEAYRLSLGHTVCSPRVPSHPQPPHPPHPLKILQTMSAVRVRPFVIHLGVWGF
jgi:hypothetical protein